MSSHRNSEDLRSVAEDLVKALDPSPDRKGLHETPSRVAKAWAFWTSGYDQSPADVLKTFEDGAADGMVFQGMIPFYSMCEHHLAPFFGFAYVAYIPQGRVVGLSKLSRVIDIFARRLQTQERLGAQVLEALSGARGLSPDVGVVLHARHMCMESRGIQRPGVYTITSALAGKFMFAPEVRAEFMGFVRMSAQGSHTL